MTKLKEELQAAVRKATSLDKLKNQIEMTVTAEGLRIELLETEKGTFFPSGIAEPTVEGKEILALLAHELGKLPNMLSVEGHTDARPFAMKGSYTNWELSSDRANAARRLMQENGIRPGQVSQVRGFADQRLRKPRDSEDPSNRRISVIVQYVVKSDNDEQRAASPTAGLNAQSEREHAPASQGGGGH